MAKKVNIVGKKAERIRNTGPSLPRVDPSEFAAAIGAEPCGEPHSEHLDPISLLALGHELLKRLRSTGGRPSLEGATEQCKVPLRPEDMAALQQMQKAIEEATGTKPSLGQLASELLRRQLEAIRTRSCPHAEKNPSPRGSPTEGNVAVIATLEGKVNEQLDSIAASIPNLAAIVKDAKTVEEKANAIGTTATQMKEHVGNRLKEVLTLLHQAN